MNTNHTPDLNAPEPERGLGASALSALADGECPSHELDAVLQRYAADPVVREDWQAYQCLSSVLREGRVPVKSTSSEFASRVMMRIVQDAEVPVRRVESAMAAPVLHAQAAANDSVFRWKLVAGVAALAAVASVGWQLVVTQAPAPQLARQETPSVLTVAERSGHETAAVLTDHGVVLRDPQLEAMLAAHRQLGGMSALQTPAGFLRNATFEAPQR